MPLQAENTVPDRLWYDRFSAEIDRLGIAPDLYAVVLTNQDVLIRLGQVAFGQIMALYERGADDEALLVIEASMTADEIRASDVQEDHDYLQKIRQQEQFVADMKRVGLQLAPIAVKALVTIASGGAAA